MDLDRLSAARKVRSAERERCIEVGAALQWYLEGIRLSKTQQKGIGQEVRQRRQGGAGVAMACPLAVVRRP
jgi:hypothetical protein